MEFLVAENDCGIPEFYEVFSHSLPMVVMVTKGYQCSIFDTVIERGQCLRVRGSTLVKRVLVQLLGLQQDTSDTYSTPLNYPLLLQVLKKRDKVGSPKTLADIVKSSKLPVDVQFAGNQTLRLGAAEIRSELAPRLRVLEVFQESHLVVNVIKDGILDLRPHTIPPYLWQLRVAPVLGLREGSNEEWERYLQDMGRKLSKAAAQFDFNIKQHVDAIYSSLLAIVDDHVYDTLEPEVEETDADKGTPSEKDEDEMYEDVVLPPDSEWLPFVSDHYARSKSSSATKPALTTEQRQRFYTGSLVDLRFQPAPPPISSLPPSRLQTVPRDYNSTYPNQQTASNSIGRRHGPGFHKCRSESDTGRPGSLPIEKPIGSVEAWQQTRVAANNDRSSFMPGDWSDPRGRDVINEQGHVEQYWHQHPPFMGSPNTSYNARSPGEYHGQVDRRSGGPAFPHPHQPATPTFIGSHAHSDVTYLPALPPRHPSSEREKATPSSDIPTPYHKYENDIQRATVPPLPAKTNRSSTSSLPPSDKEQTLKESTFTTDSEVGSDQTSGPSKYVSLVDLSVENLVDYMKVLKLDKYTTAFEEQLVDGEVLSHFDADVLKGEFGFSAVEAIRMMSFIKSGHVPNYGRTAYM